MTTRSIWFVAICTAPVLLAGALTLFWHHTGRLSIGGDEPHYLIMAASLSRDRDLDLGNNYRHDIFTKEIFGEVEPHVVRTDAGWMPYHTPGLGAVLAAPFAWGGRTASRLALCLLPLLFGCACVWGLPRTLPRDIALWVTAGTLACLPVVFGSSRIYPDLLGGFLAAALALWLWSDDRRRTVFAWGLFWLGLGALPWLHVKFAGAAAVLALAGGWQSWHAPGGSWQVRFWAAIPFAIGLASHAVFNVYAFGSIGGGRSSAELSTDPWRGLELLLGLHFDQGQGMLFQHPALVVSGLACLGWLVGTRHRVVLPWLALYAALILPNAMQLARYGGGGPAGRFGWSAVWLWLVPIGLVIADRQPPLARYVRPVVMGSVFYQMALALRWIPEPSVLFPVLSETLAERNSLFPQALRPLLPSFYFWDYRSYLVHPPNLVWVAATLALVAGGAVSRPGPRAGNRTR